MPFSIPPRPRGQFDFTQYDYIVDAIDTVTGKLALVQNAHDAGTPIISCMGTGNKLDASMFEVADITKTSMCPLARVMRRELSKRGIRHLKVVYSKEEALTPTGWEAEAAALGKRQIPGSSAFVPGTAGLILGRGSGYGTSRWLHRRLEKAAQKRLLFSGRAAPPPA